MKFGFGQDDINFLRSKLLINANILTSEADSSHCYEYLMKKSRYVDNVPGEFFTKRIKISICFKFMLDIVY